MLAMMFEKESPLAHLELAWCDTNDRSMMKHIAVLYPDLSWTNGTKPVRKGHGQSGRICTTHTWSLDTDNERILVVPEMASRFAKEMRLTADTSSGIRLGFPWLMDQDVAVAYGAFHPSRELTIDFALFEHPDNSDALQMFISPFGTSWNLTMYLADYGHGIEFEVQRKLAPPMRGALQKRPVPMFASGPAFVAHQSGENEFETSGNVTLPRPLAREGTHAYMNGGKLMQELNLDELKERGDAHAESVGSHVTLIIDVHLQSQQPRVPKRRSQFQATPPVLPLPHAVAPPPAGA